MSFNNSKQREKKSEEEVKRQELQSCIEGFLEVTQKASNYISWTSIQFLDNT